MNKQQQGNLQIEIVFLEGTQIPKQTEAGKTSETNNNRFKVRFTLMGLRTKRTKKLCS